MFPSTDVRGNPVPESTQAHRYTGETLSDAAAAAHIQLQEPRPGLGKVRKFLNANCLNEETIKLIEENAKDPDAGPYQHAFWLAGLVARFNAPLGHLTHLGITNSVSRSNCFACAGVLHEIPMCPQICPTYIITDARRRLQSIRQPGF